MRKTTIALFATFAATAIACGGGGNSADDAKSAAPAAPAAAAAKIGTPVRDGKFEFTVSGVKCGATQIGKAPLGKKAQGQFCVVDVQVANIGKEAQLLDGSAQKALDGKGVEFSNDGTAEMYANQSNETFINEINPGNKVKGKLVFDVPKGTKLTAIMLHDSAFSDGVKVTLA